MILLRILVFFLLHNKISTQDANQLKLAAAVIFVHISHLTQE